MIILVGVLLLACGYLLVQHWVNQDKMWILTNRVEMLEDFQQAYILRCLDGLIEGEEDEAGE